MITMKITVAMTDNDDLDIERAANEKKFSLTQGDQTIFVDIENAEEVREAIRRILG